VRRNSSAKSVPFLMVAALGVLGCSTPSSPSPEPLSSMHAGAAGRSSSPASPSPSTPGALAAAVQTVAPTTSGTATASGAASTCAAIAAQFDAARAAAKGGCATDADCACFGDVRVDNQMGVSDRAAAAKLQALSDDYRKQQCPTVCEQTAQPTACKARCQISGAMSSCIR
jgi:hypothetical protein